MWLLLWQPLGYPENTVTEEHKVNTGDTYNTYEDTNAVVQTRNYGFREKQLSGDKVLRSTQSLSDRYRAPTLKKAVLDLIDYSKTLIYAWWGNQPA